MDARSARCGNCYVVDARSGDRLNPLGVDPHGGDGSPHEPAPTLWPVGFAVGIACLLVGLILNWLIVAVGAVIAAIFGFLWIRDVTAEYRTEPAPGATEPAPAPPVPAHLPDEGELVRFPRAKFLEAATLGLGGVIGGGPHPP